jgi:hypothetical protein
MPRGVSRLSVNGENSTEGFLEPRATWAPPVRDPLVTHWQAWELPGAFPGQCDLIRKEVDLQAF